MHEWATLLSKGSPTAVATCKYLDFKGTQRNCNALFFHLFLMLHISIWGIEAFSGVLNGDRTGILGPL